MNFKSESLDLNPVSPIIYCVFVQLTYLLWAEDAEIQKKYFSRGLLPRESGRIYLFVVGSINQRGYVHLIRQWGQIYSVFDNKR